MSKYFSQAKDMARRKLKALFRRERSVFVLAIICVLMAPALANLSRQNNDKIKIFDGQPQVIMVHGYSTSFRWPNILQRKLDRYFDSKSAEHSLQVKRATKGGTPIAKWINVKTGEPLKPWLTILRPSLQDSADKPIIVLAQQSLQWVFGQRSEGIRSPNDRQRIQQGADALAKYVGLLKDDGADLVFVAMHIYKHPIEPQIGNERYALDELMQLNIPGVERGPDVWTPTKKLYPRAFAKDLKHPNAIGDELMAQKWFETLLKYDGLKVPAWSKQQLKRAIQPKPARPGIAPNVRVLRDLEYIPGGHERHKLDLYLPQQQLSAPLPLIVWVHGGAWRGGSKDRCPALWFLDKGYAVASINYRLSQHAIFPAQIEDCKAAIRWLRANAKRYSLAAERIGVWGSSAGGHLVALLGTTGDVEEFEVGPNLDVSSRVQAVCDFFGPTDFLEMGRFPSKMNHYAADSPESKLIGGPVLQNKEACRRANPITYITKDDPPFLIMHGDKDMTVPINQSELFYDALKKAGVPVTFHTVSGAGHGFSGPEIDKMVDDFFDTTIKASEH
ncbi:MAG: alpha/beta hydrolase fold domain-containing protein [Sedimentisphaerales bacterium]